MAPANLSSVAGDIHYSIFMQVDRPLDILALGSTCRSLYDSFQSFYGLVLDNLHKTAKSQFGEAYMLAKKVSRVENEKWSLEIAHKLEKLYDESIDISTRYGYLMGSEYYHTVDKEKLRIWFETAEPSEEDRLTSTELERFLPALFNFMLFCEFGARSSGAYLFLKEIHSRSLAQLLYTVSVFNFCHEMSRYWALRVGDPIEGHLTPEFESMIGLYTSVGPRLLVQVWKTLKQMPVLTEPYLDLLKISRHRSPVIDELMFHFFGFELGNILIQAGQFDMTMLSAAERSVFDENQDTVRRVVSKYQ